MFKLPKCKYCGEKTKLERMDVIAKNPFAIVCSKCNKHQNIGFFKEWLLIKFNKKK